MKGGKRPTAEQKRWHDWVASHECYIGLGAAEIHHCAGTTARHQKVDIGQWWVIPLSPEAHRGPHGIHGDLSLFHGHGVGESRKEIEKTIFSRLLENYHRHHGRYPMPADVMWAIEGYHR